MADHLANQGSTQHHHGGDPLASLIREKFEMAQKSRTEVELERWQPGEDAYQGRLYQTLPGNDQQVDIRFNLTRRKTQGAVTKITSMLFEAGEIPFKMRTSRHMRFVPPDLAPGAHLMTQMTQGQRQDYLAKAGEWAKTTGSSLPQMMEERRINLENRIRDILEQTDYQGELTNAIHEMVLHGTGIIKSPVLHQRNYPVYQGKFVSQQDYQLEKLLESETVPTAQFVSIFNVFPAPESTKIEDAEYVIERRFLSSVQIRQLLTEDSPLDVEAVLDVLDRGVSVEGADTSAPPDPVKGRATFDNRQYEWLEFYGHLDSEDLENRMDTDFLEEVETLPVKIIMLGDRVVEVSPHPFDGVSPYAFCYWQRNPQSVWGDGVYWALADLQDHANFCMSMYVMGKHITSMPMMVADESAFNPGETFDDLGPGRIFKTRPGQADVALRPLVVPDVSQGLMELLQYLEREADLITGQPAIGYGESNKHQTTTATGMSLLQTNMQRQMSTVMRSCSTLIQKNVEGIYRWLMTDSDDYTIKMDAEAYSTGYDRYVASEIHNQQLLQFVQLIGGMPVLEKHIHVNNLIPSVLRAYRLDPELLLKPQEQVNEEQQAALETQIKMQVAEAEIVNDRKRMELEHQIAQAEVDARFREMVSIGNDRRRLEMQERLEMVKRGERPGEPGDLSEYSYLLKDQLLREQTQIAQEQQDAQFANERRVRELKDAFRPQGPDTNTTGAAAPAVDQYGIQMGGGTNAPASPPTPRNDLPRSSEPGELGSSQLLNRQTQRTA